MKNYLGKENEPRIENVNVIGIEIVKGIGKETVTVVIEIETVIGIIIGIMTVTEAEIETEAERGKGSSGIEIEILIGTETEIGKIGLEGMKEIVTGTVIETERGVIAVRVNTRKCLVTETGTEEVLVREVLQDGVEVAEKDLLYL